MHVRGLLLVGMTAVLVLSAACEVDSPPTWTEAESGKRGAACTRSDECPGRLECGHLATAAAAPLALSEAADLCAAPCDTVKCVRASEVCVAGSELRRVDGATANRPFCVPTAKVPVGTSVTTACGGTYVGVCQPRCGEKECGSDGCGGTCGSCSGGKVCKDGSCCARQCSGKECGDDGCGGTCGACDEGESCESGTCEVVPVRCPGAPSADECCLEHNPCRKAENEACDCGGKCAWDAVDCCAPDCDGKECGDDGCGGSCGTCEGGFTCGGDGQCSGPFCAGMTETTNDCCRLGMPCESWAGDRACECEGACAWDAQDCAAGSCASFYVCTDRCEGGDQDCVNACVEEMSPAAQRTNDAYYACWNAHCAHCTQPEATNDCAEVCTNAHCLDEFASCFYFYGTAGCGETYACLIACEDDADCQGRCVEAMSGDAYASAIRFESCIGDECPLDMENAAWSACVEQKVAAGTCASEHRACFGE